MLMDMSLHLMRTRLQQILQRLNVPAHAYTWASLRAGGATFDYMQGCALSAVKFRGRWSAEKTLEHYVQEFLSFWIYHNLVMPRKLGLHGFQINLTQ